MSASLRVGYFTQASNQAFATNAGKALHAHPHSLGVTLVSADHTQAQKLANRETWRIFRKSLYEVIGREKYQWICNRYKDRYQCFELERTGSPLLPEHVEMFSAGSAQLLTKDIKRRFHTSLKQTTRAELTERLGRLQPLGLVGNYRTPRKIPGPPSSIRAYFFHDRILMDKEKQVLFSDAASLSPKAWLERFAKILCNRELLERQIIPAPGSDGRVDYYRVHKKIATGHGLVAYALKPCGQDSTLKPLIVFRPTQWAFANEDAIESYLNDVQAHVGKLGWEHAEHSIDQLVNDPRFCASEQRIDIAGYSLGGAHAQYFLAKYPAKVRNAVFFADPGVDDETATRAARAINQMPPRTEPLNIKIVRIPGDFCHYVGEKHVGWGVNHPQVNVKLVEVDPGSKVTKRKLHSHRVYDNHERNYNVRRISNAELLNQELDNTARGPHIWWYERMRRLWGGVAFYTFLGIAESIKLVSNVFGVKILRKSTDPEDLY